MSSRSGGPVVFLDKDGTLVEDVPFNVDPKRVRFVPGAQEAIRLWAEHRWRIGIVTNQQGVAHGYFTLADLDLLAAYLRAWIERLGAAWAGFFACPHDPSGINEYARACDCQKPAPGLILRAVRELGVDPAKCWFVGDMWTDMAAGRAAGCRTILVGRGWQTASQVPDEARPDGAVPDLEAAAQLVVEAQNREAGNLPPGSASRLPRGAAAGTGVG